jgi:hypothetical protein
MCGDPTVEERGQLMDGGGAGGLDGAELRVEEACELREERGHLEKDSAGAVR